MGATQALHAQISPYFLSDEKPKWELGLSVTALDLPDYPGAQTNSFRVLPFPIFIYRGDTFRMDEEGARAKIKEKKYWELGLSFGFNFRLNPMTLLQDKEWMI